MTVGAAAENKPTPPAPATHWTSIEAATGMSQLDGTLRLNFPLGDSSELKPLGIRWQLEHRLETSAYGQARSVWHIAGLRSSLAPAGREQLRWQPPAGGAVTFERARIGRALAEAGSSRWLIRESAPGEHEIRSREGKSWRYIKGVLAGAEHPAIGELRFTGQGARVREIRRAEAGSEAPPLLQAEYDEAGRVVAFTLGEQKRHVFGWNTAGELVAWSRSDSCNVGFAYRDGLLSEIAETGKPRRGFTWAKNPGYERGDSRWLAAAHLASDGANVYDYSLTPKGYMLRRLANGSGDETLTIFNPRRHRLEQRRAGGEVFIVTFRRGAAGMGALEKIENGAGEVLEAYRYDERGQLIGLTRRGQPERAFSYDETGRLMAMEERPDL